METEIINGKEFRYVELHGRGKYIARDGEAYNPKHRKQKATIHMNPDGYPCFGGGVPVHRYVAVAWVDGWFEGAEVDHIDYNRMNYHADNLRWVSHGDNIKHSYIDENHYKGTKAGESNGRATLYRCTVEAIKKLFDYGMKTYEVIKIFHPNATAKERRSLWNRYNRIKTGETWS